MDRSDGANGRGRGISRRAKSRRALFARPLVLALALSALFLPMPLRGGETLLEEMLRNDDIVQLVKSGFGQAIIDEKINSSRVNFDLTASGMSRLKDEGVSEEILGTMIQRQRSFQAETAAAIRRAIDGLVNPRPEQQRASISILRDRFFPACVPYLEMELSNARQPQRRAAAAQALGELGARAAAASILPLMTDTSLDACLAAAEALHRLESQEGLRAAREILHNRTDRPEGAIRLLGLARDMESVLFVGLRLWDSRSTVRREAARALGIYRLADLRPDLEKALGITAERPDVRIELIASLSRLGMDESLETLFRVIQQDSDGGVREHAIRSLSHYSPRRAAPFLIEEVLLRAEELSLSPAEYTATTEALRTLTLEDFGMERHAWVAWLALNRERLAPQPVAVMIEMINEYRQGESGVMNQQRQNPGPPPPAGTPPARDLAPPGRNPPIPPAAGNPAPAGRSRPNQAFPSEPPPTGGWTGVAPSFLPDFPIIDPPRFDVGAGAGQPNAAPPAPPPSPPPPPPLGTPAASAAPPPSGLPSFDLLTFPGAEGFDAMAEPAGSQPAPGPAPAPGGGAPAAVGADPALRDRSVDPRVEQLYQLLRLGNQGASPAPPPRREGQNTAPSGSPPIPNVPDAPGASGAPGAPGVLGVPDIPGVPGASSPPTSAAAADAPPNLAMLLEELRQAQGNLAWVNPTALDLAAQPEAPAAAAPPPPSRQPALFGAAPEPLPPHPPAIDAAWPSPSHSPSVQHPAPVALPWPPAQETAAVAAWPIPETTEAVPPSFDSSGLGISGLAPVQPMANAAPPPVFTDHSGLAAAIDGLGLAAGGLGTHPDPAAAMPAESRRYPEPLDYLMGASRPRAETHSEPRQDSGADIPVEWLDSVMRSSAPAPEWSIPPADGDWLDAGDAPSAASVSASASPTWDSVSLLDLETASLPPPSAPHAAPETEWGVSIHDPLDVLTRVDDIPSLRVAEAEAPEWDLFTGDPADALMVPDPAIDSMASMAPAAGQWVPPHGWPEAAPVSEAPVFSPQTNTDNWELGIRIAGEPSSASGAAIDAAEWPFTPIMISDDGTAPAPWIVPNETAPAALSLPNRPVDDSAFPASAWTTDATTPADPVYVAEPLLIAPAGQADSVSIVLPTATPHAETIPPGAVFYQPPPPPAMSPVASWPPPSTNVMPNPALLGEAAAATSPASAASQPPASEPTGRSRRSTRASQPPPAPPAPPAPNAGGSAATSSPPSLLGEGLW